MNPRTILLSGISLFTSLVLMAQNPWVVQTTSPMDEPYFGITSANGQIGLVSSREPLHADKVIVGGLYDVCGRKQVDNYFANINPLTVTLWMNGQQVTTDRISNYVQSFDFRNATFHGRFDVADIAHVDYTMVALRHLPFGCMMDVTIEAKQSLQLDAVNTHDVGEQLHSVQTIDHHNLLTTEALSPTSRWKVAASSAFMFPDTTPNTYQSQRFSQPMQAGQRLHFAVVGTVLGSNVAQDVRNEAQRLTLYQLMEGYDRLWQRHNAEWATLWQSDIQIDGPAQDQQDIHNMLYHLYAFNREGSGLSSPPMGLSGQGYHGHLFWDSETWMFPALAVMQPKIAVEMLNYRFDRLQAAHRNAYLHGYRGAMFPWESAYTGEEETPLPHLYAEAEIHISADIAIACWQYFCLTQDQAWLQQKGWPILQSTAEFWVSRVEWDQQGRAHLNNVIGADEWTRNPFGGKNVNDNAYTNASAKTNLLYAIRAARVLGKKAPKEWQQTADGLQFDYMDNGVIAEHDTYDGHVIKQADVILLAYPLHIVTDHEQIRRDLEYYSAKTPDKKTPAMSKSIYATLYSRLGEQDKALYYFRDAYLPNLNPPFRVMAEFNGGTNPYFLTGAGGILQSLIFGFAGLDITDKGLKRVYSPTLPNEWRSITILRAGQKR